MPLTPIDIQQKTFGPELRGYNMDEVDDFLDDVVAALKDYDQRVRDAQDRIRALEAELSTRGEDESAISRALVAAQKQADAIVSDARSEADRIHVEASDEADRLRSEREAERMALTQDIARMRATVADLKRRVFELATSVDSDLEEMDAAAAVASRDLEQEPLPVDGEELTETEDAYASADIGDGLDPFDTDRADAVAEIEEEAEIEQAEEWQEHDESEGQHLAPDADDLAVELEDEDAHSATRRPWERGSV